MPLASDDADGDAPGLPVGLGDALAVGVAATLGVDDAVELAIGTDEVGGIDHEGWGRPAQPPIARASTSAVPSRPLTGTTGSRLAGPASRHEVWQQIRLQLLELRLGWRSVLTELCQSPQLFDRVRRGRLARQNKAADRRGDPGKYPAFVFGDEGVEVLANAPPGVSRRTVAHVRQCPPGRFAAIEPQRVRRLFG